ncbi:MAG: hypothetical protein FD174_4341 [Geobacteraceae bacterium]|nr:MAG: hypothetical protein FD174_4341 [Geobacteraceae bacterium]
MSQHVAMEINKIKAQLTWHLFISHDNESDFPYIASFPEEQAHNIYLTVGNDEDSLALLHELVHAKFAETISPMFSSSIYGMDVPKEQIEAVERIVYTAVNWFVDGEVARLCPDEFSQAVAARVSLSLGQVQRFTPDCPFFWGNVLLIAQNIKYRQITPPMDEKTGALVNIILATPTDNPTEESLLALINSLAAFTTHYQIGVILNKHRPIFTIQDK